MNIVANILVIQLIKFIVNLTLPSQLKRIRGSLSRSSEDQRTVTETPLGDDQAEIDKETLREETSCVSTLHKSSLID